jgi:hypothetical protein
VRHPPRGHTARIAALDRRSLRDRPIEARIDDVALVTPLEQVSGLPRGRAIGGKAVEHDIDTEFQAMLCAQPCKLVHRVRTRA